MAKRGRKKQSRSTPEVEKAILAIRQAHTRGREIIARIGRTSKYGKSHVQEEAQRLGVNVDAVRKLRQFADRRNGYTKAELGELARQCREHGRALGVTFLHKLVSIPKEGGQRAQFQEEILRENYSKRQVNLEIRARFGRRKQGGKRPAVAETVTGVLSQIDGVCVQWERLQQRIADPKEFEKQRIANPRKYDGESTLRDQLPPTIQGMLITVDAVMAQLQQAVAAELERSRQK